MRFPLALLSGFAVTGVFSGSADDCLPLRFNFDRYTQLLDHSPFAIATAAALPETTPDFAKDLYVANAAHSADADMATIMSSSDHDFKKYLNTKGPVDGYSIVSIEWSDRVGATRVTISKDGNLATLAFNQLLMSQSAPAVPSFAGQMPKGVAINAPPGAGQSPRSHAHDAHGVAQQNPKSRATPAPVRPSATPNPGPLPALPDLEPPALPDPESPKTFSPQQQLLPKQEVGGEHPRQ